MALESINAAQFLAVSRWRGMANRIYYALFAESHARLIVAGLRPRPGRGTWNHADLPRLVRHHLASRRGPAEARKWSQTLRLARQVRESADYGPQMSVDRSTLVSLLSRVGELVGATA